MDNQRRNTDRWNTLNFAIPAAALFLITIGFGFTVAISNTSQEQDRLRREHSHLMQLIVDTCRSPQR